MTGALTAGQGYIQPVPAWHVTMAGIDLTDKLAPRLISLSLSERHAEAAEELELVLHDSDGLLNLPPEGAVLTVAIGWARGTGVAVGLVEKGSFVVDHIEWEGPPDALKITGRSANLRTDFRNRKSRTWHNHSLTAITTQIATDNGLTPRCHPDLADTIITAAEQANQSDMEFLRDLGRRYDALATVKDGCLLFAPIGATITATGQTIPTLTITKRGNDKYHYHRASREAAQDGAESQWHDQRTGKRKTVSTGGSHRRRLKRVHASHADAHAAAQSEAKRLKRAAATLEIDLGYGNPQVSVGMHTTVSGFKAEIDAHQWLVAHVAHEMSGSGLKTKVELSVAG